MKKFILYILFLFIGFHVSADDVEFKVSAPKAVETGQQFRIVFTVNAQPDKFVPPAIENFSVLAGPSTSSSSNISIINGKMTRTFSILYTYILHATTEGEHTIGEAEIEVDNKKYKTKPFTIEVIKGKQQPATNQSNREQQGNQNNTGNVSDKDLFLRVNLSRSTLYQGEHVVATIKLYTKLQITGLEAVKFPNLDGFLAEEIEVPPLTQLEQEVINGEVYGTGILKKYLLYPQKNGKLRIDPAELDVIYQKATNRRSRSIFDDFFGSYEKFKQNIKSQPRIVNVLALPENKPMNFSGGVGNLKMSASIDKNDVKVNDAITLKVKISGNGNLRVVDPMDIGFPADFEVYDPKVIENIRYSESGGVGSKTFEYLIIPRHAGDFRIDPFSFVYFNPSSKSYKTIESPEFNIKVEKGEGDTTVTMTSVFAKEDVKFIGKDIRFIKTGAIKLRDKTSNVFGSTLFWSIYIIGGVIFLLVFVLRRRYIKQNANVQLMKNKKASKYAQKRLKTASGYLKAGNKEAYYEELAKALWGYLSDKLAIPVANLSKENASDELQKREVSQDIIDEFISVLDTCEFARYAPSSGAEQMDELYSNAIDVISKLQQKLK